MPELPEVETIRAQLAAVLPGRRIARIEIMDAKAVEPDEPESVRAALAGAGIVDVGRRGKYLLLHLDTGSTAIIHLRMTGQLHWSEAAPTGPEEHRRALITFEGGATLLFCDLRRFGRLRLEHTVRTRSREFWAGRLGVEPLSPAFTADALAAALSRRSAPIKAVLLDQSTVAGIGNIYADEALFGAGVHPQRPASSLGPMEIARLHRAIRSRLRAAIAQGGTSFDRYRDTRGERGAMQRLLKVYGRAGEPCTRCRGAITKTRVAQRGTYICLRCQPRQGPPC